MAIAKSDGRRGPGIVIKGLLAAGAAAALLGATVIVTATSANADEQYWGAIAYSLLDGASGSSSQQRNESDARAAAIFDCVNNGGSKCEVVVTVERSRCASLVANESLFSTGVAESRDEPRKSALADLAEPGSEAEFTCGFIAGASAAPTSPASPPVTATAPPRGQPIPAPIPPAPTLR
jgi:Domain of unknown function (DUF4189)